MKKLSAYILLGIGKAKVRQVTQGCPHPQQTAPDSMLLHPSARVGQGLLKSRYRIRLSTTKDRTMDLSAVPCMSPKSSSQHRAGYDRGLSLKISSLPMYEKGVWWVVGGRGGKVAALKDCSMPTPQKKQEID
jgi:hypothetical protein